MSCNNNNFQTHSQCIFNGNIYKYLLHFKQSKGLRYMIISLQFRSHNAKELSWLIIGSTLFEQIPFFTRALFQSSLDYRNPHPSAPTNKGTKINILKTKGKKGGLKPQTSTRKGSDIPLLP
ncbi:hypothetical protein ACB094_08G106000 [Castanea mollissima]